MLYLYAIVERPAAPLVLGAGLHDQALHCRSWNQVGAIYSHLEETPRPVAATLWRHEEVVEGLLGERSVLPVRFGTLLADEASLEGLLRERHDHFVAGLVRVAGRVELGLRVLWDVPTAPTPVARPAAENGRDYMLRRMAEERAVEERRQAARAQAGALHMALARLAVADVERVLPSERMLLSAAYLVERDAVSNFRAAVRALSAEHPGLRLLCTGPWPAYHFVDAEGA